MNLSEIQSKVEFIKCVLASRPGAGKTAAGLTFPLPMKIFEFDGKAKLLGPARYAQSLGIDINQIDIVTPDMFNNDWTTFDRMLQDLRKNPGKNKSFGFDTYTSIGDTLIGYTSEGKLKQKGDKVKKVGGAIQVPEVDEWMAEITGLMDILVFMKEVNANVWLGCHILETKRRNLESGLETVETTILTGGKKPAARIPAYFPEAYKLMKQNPLSDKDPIQFVVETRSPDDDYARTNYEFLPRRFDITGKKFYDVLIGLINSGLASEANKERSLQG